MLYYFMLFFSSSILFFYCNTPLRPTFPPYIQNNKNIQIQSNLLLGSKLTMSVTASGDKPLSYRWYKDNEIIPKATDSSYVISALVEGHQGKYTCVVSNKGGSVTSNPYILQIKDVENSKLIYYGKTVFASGVPKFNKSFFIYILPKDIKSLKFQWYKENVKFEGATNDTLHFNQLTDINEGSFFCEVRSKDLLDTSIVFNLTIDNNPPEWKNKEMKVKCIEGTLIQLSLNDSCKDKDGENIKFTLLPGKPNEDYITEKNIYKYPNPNVEKNHTVLIHASDGKVTTLGIVNIIKNVDTPPKPIIKDALGEDQKIVISWNKVEGAASYKLYWSKKPKVTKKSDKISNVTSPYSHTGLTNETKYYYALTAINKNGESKLSKEVFAIPTNITKIPSPPTNVKATPANNEISISWNNSPTASSYTIYWSINPNVTTNSEKISNMNSPYTHTGLTNGTKYYYAVTASNKIGESKLSKEVLAIPEITEPPTVPSLVQAIADYKETSISWSKSSTASSYSIYWSRNPNITKKSDKISKVTSPYTHTGLNNETKYYYAVTASNKNGESKLSKEVFAVPFERKMVLISSAGKQFQMGSENGDEWEKPVHTVKFTYDFYIGKYVVTQKEYEALMDTNPSCFKGYDLPVETVNWYDAVLYCNALSKNEGFDTVYQYSSIEGTPGNGCKLKGIKINLNKKGYRLPTEAEWEHACRGGTTTEYYWGDGTTNIDNYAWYQENSGQKPHPVGQKKPNTFGLYDMSGNVYEWCNDWFEDYKEGKVEDPTGPDTGVIRILRGGAGYKQAKDCRSAHRSGYKPVDRYWFHGFRLARGQIKK